MDQIQLFGSALHCAREKTGKDQKTVAKEIGISVFTIRKWEGGRAIPPKGRIPFISRAYEIEERILQNKFEIIIRDKKSRSIRTINKICNSGPKRVGVMFSGDINSSRITRRTNVRLERN
jgi:ribosome-binding protein aMBF1 (putative translation factor)